MNCIKFQTPSNTYGRKDTLHMQNLTLKIEIFVNQFITLHFSQF